MISATLKKFANSRNMKVSAGIAYGVLDGYMVTLSTSGNEDVISFSCALTDSAVNRMNEKLSQKDTKRSLAIRAYNITRECVTLFMPESIGFVKKFEKTIKLLPEMLKECGAIGDGFCTACGNYIDPMQEQNVVLINGVAHRIHKGCADSLDNRAEMEQEIYKSESKNLGKGILGALLGAFLGGIVWGVVYYIGYFAAIIGVLIAFLSKKGYELLGGKLCKAKVFIILFATILGVLFGQLGADLVSIIIETSQYGYTFLDSPFLLLYLFQQDSEFTGAFVSDLFGGMFFGIIGALGTVLASNKEHKNATLKTTVLE